MRLLLSLTALALSATPVLAQNPQTAPPASPVAPVAPPNSPSPPPEQIAPPAGNSSGTLSKRLSQQSGTLKPPNVDPGITVKPPANQTTNMPVLKPPGSPGGNPNVVPK